MKESTLQYYKERMLKDWRYCVILTVQFTRRQSGPNTIFAEIAREDKNRSYYSSVDIGIELRSALGLSQRLFDYRFQRIYHFRIDIFTRTPNLFPDSVFDPANIPAGGSANVQQNAISAGYPALFRGVSRYQCGGELFLASRHASSRQHSW